MRLTNRGALPDAILQAVKNDPYNKGGADFSVTELLSPPRQAALKLAHKDEITEDVEDRLHSLYGQIAHGILERANRNDLAEKRFFIKVAGVTVSGQIDSLDLAEGILSDYKFTTSYKFKEGSETPPEWVAQLNMQAELLRQHGHTVNKLQIIGLLRDFSKLEARRDPEYPRASIVGMHIPLWESSRALRYIQDRVILHQQARLSLPSCTPEERWERPTKYAVMKVGGKRAVKLYDNEGAAKDHAAMEPKLYVEKRQGESIRCGAYCVAAAHCSQFKTLSQDGAEDVLPAVAGA